jgi:hypothetical protein
MKRLGNILFDILVLLASLLTLAWIIVSGIARFLTGKRQRW